MYSFRSISGHDVLSEDAIFIVKTKPLVILSNTMSYYHNYTTPLTLCK